MKNILIVIFVISLSSCSQGQDKKDILIKKLNSIENWKIEFIKGETDTIGVKNWLPNPELHIEFITKKKSDCLKPYFDFYPIELDSLIESKLMNYLMLRSTIYPPTPNIYITEDYYIISWKLIDYDGKVCCDCKQLENEIIDKLGLIPEIRTHDIWKWISQNPLSRNEVQEIVSLAFDLDDLQQYFHLSEDKSRTPLVIQKSGQITGTNLSGLEMFDEQILVLEKEEIQERKIPNYFTIDDWTYSGKSLRLMMSYEIEGIQINYLFRKIDGKWNMDNSIIVEN